MKSLAICALSAAALGCLSTAASAADLLAPLAPPIMAPAPLAADWSGAYVGANAGYLWGTASGATFPDFAADGIILGGQIGYNFELDNGLVVGAQADMDWSNAHGTTPSGNTIADVDWTGAVTGRLGYAFDAIMPYALGGVAFAHGKGTEKVPPAVGSDTAVFTGWTAGVGVEAMMTDALSAFVEYRYADYGSQQLQISGVTSSESFTASAVRAGLNFHF